MKWTTTLARHGIAAGAVLLFSAAASAQDNPLLGSWQRVERASQAGPASIAYLSFQADGNYEYRLIVGTNKAGTGSGVARTLGQYELTGQGSADYWETRYLVCPAAQYCSDYPVSDPNFGRRKSIAFEMLGDGRMSMGGMMWSRAQ